MRSSWRMVMMAIGVSYVVGFSTAMAQSEGTQDGSSTNARVEDKADPASDELKLSEFDAEVERLTSAVALAKRFATVLSELEINANEFVRTKQLSDLAAIDDARHYLSRVRGYPQPGTALGLSMDPLLPRTKETDAWLAEVKAVVDAREERPDNDAVIFAALRPLRSVTAPAAGIFTWRPRPTVVEELKKTEEKMVDALSSLEATWGRTRSELRSLDLAIPQVDTLERNVDAFKHAWLKGTSALTALRMALNQGAIPADFKASSAETIRRFLDEVEHIHNAIANPGAAPDSPRIEFVGDGQSFRVSPETPATKQPLTKIEARIRKAAEKTLAKLQEAAAAIDKQLEGEDASIDDLDRLANNQSSIEQAVVDMQTIIHGAQWGLPNQLQRIREAEATANSVLNPPTDPFAGQTGMSGAGMPGGMPGGGMPGGMMMPGMPGGMGRPTAPRTDSGYEPPPGVSIPGMPGSGSPGGVSPIRKGESDRLAKLRELRSALSNEQDPTNRQGLLQQIVDELGRVFDEQTASRKKELDEVAARLAEKQKELADREANRDAMIRRRAEQILEEVEGNGWREDQNEREPEKPW